jgi:hypothetical protein
MDPNKGAFVLFTCFQVPSVLCAIHIFFQYTQRASALRRLQNHLLMCLLIVATWSITIDLINTQIYFWTGSVTIHAYWFCSLWNTSFLTAATLNRLLMAMLCVERHFLVFRPQLYRTRRLRLIFHYTPLILIISIVLTYIIITDFFLTCPELNYYYSLFMCGYNCTVLIRKFGIIYAWLWVFTPTLIAVISSVLLPIRFIIQKRQLQQVDWNRSRKMIIQTSVIAGVYIICWLPYTILLQLLINNIVSFFNPDLARYFAIVPYVPSLLTPFIVLHTIRRAVPVRIVETLKHHIFPQRQGLVQPMNNFVVQQQNVLTGDKNTQSKGIKIA